MGEAIRAIVLPKRMNRLQPMTVGVVLPSSRRDLVAAPRIHPITLAETDHCGIVIGSVTGRCGKNRCCH